MSIEPREWVVYEPPKSVSFGHQSRIRDPRLAWPPVDRFMADLTQHTLGSHIELTCHGPSLRTGSEVASARLQEARRCFGPEIGDRAIHRTHPRWRICESQLTLAIQFALNDDRFPKQEVGPTRFHFAYNFRWREFDVCRDVSDDPRNSVSLLGVTIGQQRLFLQPNFVYPASYDSEFVKDFIDRTELIVPFRFRDQYFKRWLPPRSPATKFGRYLRLEPTWRRGSVN